MFSRRHPRCQFGSYITSMKAFTAEQREYLERRFTQLTAAMVRPTTSDQGPSSASSADPPANGDNGKHVCCHLLHGRTVRGTSIGR